MRILYIARHGQKQSNDDEGAILFALRQLGQEVEMIHELEAGRMNRRWLKGDLLLCHHWRDFETLRGIEGIRKVCWCFDLIRPDADCHLQTREPWAREMLATVDLMFFTDGDWVEDYNRERDGTKAVWLLQGADERVIGRGTKPTQDVPPLLFVGSARYSTRRLAWLEGLRTRYGDKLRHVEKGIHGRTLADLIAGAQIVLAPDHPVTDRYWSNRVYMTLGFGGFLLHPESEGLRNHYRDGWELELYETQEELYVLIDLFLEDPQDAAETREAALTRTKQHHLYRHRVEGLLATVKERLGI